MFLFAATILLASMQPQAPAQADRPGFDFWGTGAGPLFYNRLSGDCERIRHRIGRNAVWGGYSVPLQRVRWSIIPSSSGGAAWAVRLACADGDCIDVAARGSQAGPTTLATHNIPFDSQQRAERFVSDLEELKSSCRR